jgi:hypothetical protein
MTTEKKVIGGIALVTVIALISGVALASQGGTSSIPKEQVVSVSGIHWHPKLFITIEGKRQALPPNIGNSGSSHGEIHTHEQDADEGVIHLEMKGNVTKDEIQLGKFLQTWDENLSVQNLRNTMTDAEGKVTMLVNGKENKENDNYVMQDNDSIELIYE